MSLATVTLAVADFVGSAWLVAVTCTTAREGRSAGAVYVPSAAIVPVAALPPATPFTLQVTLASVAFFTVAMNSWVFPRMTDALPGFTDTVIDGGGGGGGGPTKPAPPPAQP
jgi:hypothetical protein